jgi:steroid 5-alpha reductase family enzyme
MDVLINQLLPLFAVNLVVAITAVLVLWLISIPLRDVSIIDMVFALIFGMIAAVSFFVGEGWETRKLLIALMLGIWGLRITVHLVRRNWGHGEDPRYTALRSWVEGDRAFYWLSLKKVFLLQGVVIWLASLPLQAGMAFSQPAALGWPAKAGIALWTLGFLFETVADHQLTRFRADPDNRGKVLSSGLWRYSRHPNYFGELCVWWGLFLVACDNPLGLLTVIGPLVYSHLVINVTGQRTLDKKLSREKPGYREYMETTSGLIPLPPKSRTGN